MTEEHRERVRAVLAAQIEGPLRLALRSGFDPDEIAKVVADVLPGLCDRRAAHAAVERAYDARNSDLDRALPMDTGPFEPVDIDVG